MKIVVAVDNSSRSIGSIFISLTGNVVEEALAEEDIALHVHKYMLVLCLLQ